MKFEVKYLFPTSSSGAHFYICEMPEGLGMGKIWAHGTRMQKNPQTREDMVLGCKRIHKPGRTFSGFSRVFMELYGSKVQLAPQHGYFIMASLTPKSSIFKWKSGSIWTFLFLLHAYLYWKCHAIIISKFIMQFFSQEFNVLFAAISN